MADAWTNLEYFPDHGRNESMTTLSDNFEQNLLHGVCILCRCTFPAFRSESMSMNEYREEENMQGQQRK